MISEALKRQGYYHLYFDDDIEAETLFGGLSATKSQFCDSTKDKLYYNSKMAEGGFDETYRLLDNQEENAQDDDYDYDI